MPMSDDKHKMSYAIAVRVCFSHKVECDDGSSSCRHLQFQIFYE